MIPRQSHEIAKQLKISGIVQGVGFRPFVFQLAMRYGLKGQIANTGEGVEIRIQGAAENVRRFIQDLPALAPPLARITGLQEQEIVINDGYNDFSIAVSHTSVTARSVLISPDVAVCRDCLAELFDPTDRRYHYPFINCTNCGPRYTIIDDIPYDRPYTSMKHFTMCPACQAEYDNPADRRFHAQPNACPICGPQLTMLNPDGTVIAGRNPIKLAAERLKKGEVGAIKGLGGFHLAVDAVHSTAVEKLRARKHREEKPLALMARDVAAVGLFAHVTAEEEHLLNSMQRPIVLLVKKTPNPIAAQVAPGNRYFGVMLPYTPLHHLLMAYDFKALVMTSANLSEEPIAIDNQEALARLSGIADFFLVHNRDIYLRSDDSIVRNTAGGQRLIRRSRGYIPTPIFLSRPQPAVLACGGELKNTICLTRRDQAFLSQHIGDLENAATEEFFELTIRHMQRILSVMPELIAHDLHPDYLSTRYALKRTDKPRAAVQHHHAHIVACMAENQVRDAVIGLAFDGTGLGDDGRIWGGEILLARPHGYERLAHLAYVPMPGGTAAIREPWRMALAYLLDAFGEGFPDLGLPFVRKLEPLKVNIITQMTAKAVNSPLTSSLGRFFDGMAALMGLRNTVRYEGQAAMELEMIAAEDADPPVYDYEWTSGRPHGIMTRPLVRGVVADLMKGLPPAVISAKFHATLVRLFTELCTTLADATGLKQVALSGGVFQNAILLTGLMKGLEANGFTVYTHQKVPCNDGGLSLGQAVAAAAMIQEGVPT